MTTTSGTGILGDAITNLAWIDDGTYTCNEAISIYCFGTDRVQQVDPFPAPQRRAFVSAQPWTVAGIASADAQCQSDAFAAGLPGTYLALLPTANAAASSRFTIGVPWSRVDGAVLTTTLANGFYAPLDVLANGALISQTEVWTGGDPTTAPVGGTPCSNWTSVSMQLTTTTGGSADAGPNGFTSGNATCKSNIEHLYCFQQ
jgi:hypothetical protein